MNQRGQSWIQTLMSGLTVVGVAAAAAYTSVQTNDKAIGITAWVAVAVVGAATMISTERNANQ